MGSQFCNISMMSCSYSLYGLPRLACLLQHFWKDFESLILNSFSWSIRVLCSTSLKYTKSSRTTVVSTLGPCSVVDRSTMLSVLWYLCLDRPNYSSLSVWAVLSWNPEGTTKSDKKVPTVTNICHGRLVIKYQKSRNFHPQSHLFIGKTYGRHGYHYNILKPSGSRNVA